MTVQTWTPRRVSITRSHYCSKLSSPPAQYTQVQGTASVSPGVRCVQHFPYLGLLGPVVDGYVDITQLYVRRFGLPIMGQVVFIRTCQQIDGWNDVPKVTSAIVPAA